MQVGLSLDYMAKLYRKLWVCMSLISQSNSLVCYSVSLSIRMVSTPICRNFTVCDLQVILYVYTSFFCLPDESTSLDIMAFYIRFVLS